MARFDTDTLELFDRLREVRIETVRPDDRPQRTIIWIVADAGEAFVRSWRGDRARWYQAALDRPSEVVIHTGRREVPARAVPAIDEDSVARCSDALARKYVSDPSTPFMLRSEILATTLRLEPR